MTRNQRLIIWAVALAVFLLLLHALEQILLPFVAGLAIAYLLDPIADRIEAMGLSRILATIIITVAFFLVVIGVVIVLVPLLQSQIVGIAARVPEFIAVLQKIAAGVLEQLQAKLPAGTIGGAESLAGDVAKAVAGTLKNVAQKLWTSGVALFELISLVIVTPIVSFYMLLKWDVIVAEVDDLLPRPQAETIRQQFREIDRTLSGFLRGQASVCVTLAIYYGAALSIVGLDAGLLIGLGAGAISFVPYVGALTGIGVGLGVAIVQFDSLAPIISVAGIFIVGQLAESYLLTPRLVGDRVGLSDLWIIFALMAGGALFGFLGVLLAVPTAAVIGVLARFTAKRYKESPLYLGDRSSGQSGADGT